jgi:rSAM/selenodomain-associated transferase 1
MSNAIPGHTSRASPSPAGTISAQLIVLAKAPVPGRVKTRLTPPFTPQEAAMLAEAALADTLEAGASASFARHTLALDDQRAAPGALRAELPARFEVSPQRGRGLDERIAAAFDDAYACLAVPVVLIGMDTPQVTPGLLETVAQPLAAGDADAVFGPAEDGGFWLLGLRRPDPRLILGVPMSADDTGRVQLDRLRAAGLRVRQVPELLDVDTAADAERVARQAPGSRFAATLASLLPADRSQPALTGRHHQARPAPAAALG